MHCEHCLKAHPLDCGIPHVMRRIAAPMVGGMVSSTLLTLIVIPALYALVKEFGIRRA